MAKDSTTLTVQIPVDIKERLERLAEATDRGASLLTEEALRRYLDLEEWRISEIQVGIREADAGEFATDEQVRAFFDSWRDKS